MRRGFVYTAASLLIMLVGTAGLTGSAGAGSLLGQRTGSGVLVRTDSGQSLPRHGGTVDSLNWAGYAVTPSADDVTAVRSTFTVPKAGLLPPGFGATWTGIGGYRTTDLIQAGAAESSLPSNPLLGDQYYAWYELLPGAETQLTGCRGDSTCAVAPGDRMTVDISRVGTNKWSISERDAGHWTWSKIVSYHSSESSAEWIFEAPSLDGLQTLAAPAGTVEYGPTSTYTAGRTTRTIAAGDPTQIDLSLGLLNEATPSALGSSGSSFAVCAYAQTCAMP